MEMVILSLEINYTGIYVLLMLAVLYLCAKYLKSTTTMRKMGMTSMNLMLFSNLKNYINALPDEQRAVYEMMFHDLIYSDMIHQQINCLQIAISQLEQLQVQVGETGEVGEMEKEKETGAGETNAGI